MKLSFFCSFIFFDLVVEWNLFLSSFFRFSFPLLDVVVIWSSTSVSSECVVLLCVILDIFVLLLFIFVYVTPVLCVGVFSYLSFVC